MVCHVEEAIINRIFIWCLQMNLRFYALAGRSGAVGDFQNKRRGGSKIPGNKDVSAIFRQLAFCTCKGKAAAFSGQIDGEIKSKIRT